MILCLILCPSSLLLLLGTTWRVWHHARDICSLDIYKHWLLIYKHLNSLHWSLSDLSFITSVYQVDQAWVPFGEATLTTDDFLALNVPGNVFPGLAAPSPSQGSGWEWLTYNSLGLPWGVTRHWTCKGLYTCLYFCIVLSWTFLIWLSWRKWVKSDVKYSLFPGLLLFKSV